MVEDAFKKENLDFYLPSQFKGMSKKYILDQIFNLKIQDNWTPKVGDVIVGCTGNVFVISNEHICIEEMGGNLFFFGGGLCNRDGGNRLNETYSFTMNKGGEWVEYTSTGYEVVPNVYHSSISNFRFVPYPHELINNLRYVGK